MAAIRSKEIVYAQMREKGGMMEFEHLDPGTAKYLLQPAADAIKEANQLAASQQYTPEYKSEQLDKIRERAAFLTEKRYAEIEQRYTDERPKLLKKGYIAAPTNPAEIARLTYTKEAIEAQVQRLNEFQILQAWEAAVTQGDKAALQVFHDFGEAWIRGKREGEHADMPMSEQFDELKQKAALTINQSAYLAQHALATEEKRRWELTLGKGWALNQVNGMRIDGGAFVDAITADISSQPRRY